MNNCIFCKIIKGQIPKALIWEDDLFLAFLSIAPIKEGHTLVIPKKHVDYIFDLEDSDLEKLLVVSKPVAQALKQTFNPQTGKVGVMVAGGEVLHAHIHLIPMDSERDLNFENAQHSVEFDSLEKTAEKIRSNIH